jgi:hypothetical protein
METCLNWTSVKERLPDKNGEYIVFFPYPSLNPNISTRVFKDGFFLMFVFPEVRYMENLPFTHWMPPPEMPNELD